MQYWKQLVKHGENNGDCFRTCVACLLDKTPEEVPHFFDKSNDKPYEKMREWLRGIDLDIAFIPVWDVSPALMRTVAPGLYYILCGRSSDGENHAIIGCNGETVFDPSWTDVGISQPLDNDEYYIAFLIDKRFTNHE